MPPTVAKQVATIPNSKVPPKTINPRGGLLGRAVSVQQLKRYGISICIYGISKTGKTRLASTFPKPLLILGAEDGTRSIDTVEGIDFIRIILRGKEKSYIEEGDTNYVLINEVGNILKEVSKSNYKTIILDTGSALEDLLLADILGLDEVPVQNKWGMAQRDHYAERGIRIKTIFRDILTMRMNSAILCHEKSLLDDEEEKLDGVPYIGSSLSNKVSHWLNGQCDYIGQTYKRQEMKEVVTKLETGKELRKMKATGHMQYCLRVEPSDIYYTGFRTNPSCKLVDIVDPTYDKIYEMIHGGG